MALSSGRLPEAATVDPKTGGYPRLALATDCTDCMHPLVPRFCDITPLATYRFIKPGLSLGFPSVIVV